MTLTRRRMIRGLGFGALTAASTRGLANTATAAPAALDAALASSPLIYLSPLQSSGALSRCQAEVWFQAVPGAVIVVTRADAWRAVAIQRGLTSAQLWVGDVGLWQRSRERYRTLPSVRATGQRVTDSDQQRRLLELFGGKYRREWGVWGPRFQRGLTEGSRVMLRYDLELIN